MTDSHCPAYLCEKHGAVVGYVPFDYREPGPVRLVLSAMGLLLGPSLLFWGGLAIGYYLLPYLAR